MYTAFDIETAANEFAETFWSNKEYTPDSTLSPIDKVPQKTLDIKNDALRITRIAEWKENQAIKIAKNIEEKKATDRSKSGLYWWTGKVICICTKTLEGEKKTFNDLNEAKLLNDFFTYAHDMNLIGKNSKEFDSPFLVGRAMFHDIGIPPCLRHTEQRLTDVQQIWGFSRSASQVSSLSSISWGLGLDPKLMDGSKVQGLYNEGKHEIIEEYCQHDTYLVLEILRRWEKRFEL